MNRVKSNNLKVKKRALRIRAKLFGTASKPRASIFRSNRYTYIQAIDDSSSKTLMSVSTRQFKTGTKSEQAASLGLVAAEKAKSVGIEAMVFDKGPYKYHGRVKEVAEGLRKSGIKI